MAKHDSSTYDRRIFLSFRLDLSALSDQKIVFYRCQNVDIDFHQISDKYVFYGFKIYCSSQSREGQDFYFVISRPVTVSLSSAKFFQAMVMLLCLHRFGFNPKKKHFSD